MTAMAAEKLPLFLGFDPLGNDGQPQVLSQSYDGADNDRVVGIGQYVSDERPINFQLV
jgi:hypothetical protein